jgi:hypothetical protein
MAFNTDKLVQRVNHVIRQAATTSSSDYTTSNNAHIQPFDYFPGALIGVIVGGSVAGSLFLALVIWLIIRRRRRNAARATIKVFEEEFRSETELVPVKSRGDAAVTGTSKRT